MRASAICLLLWTGCAAPPPPPDAAPDAAPPMFVTGTLRNMWDGASVALKLTSPTGSEVLTLDHDGPFAFASPVPPETSFSVEVATPPPGHVCTVATSSTVDVDCRVVTNLYVPLPPGVTFDPATIQYDLGTSFLADSTTVTVTAPSATSIKVEGIEVPSGVPSPAFRIPMGDRTLTVEVRVGALRHATFVHVSRGAAPLKQAAYLKASRPQAGARFGASVAVSDDRIVIGAPGEDDGAGAVYVYRRSGTDWALEARVTAPTAHPGDAFGSSIGLDHDLLAIGSPGESASAGAAYLFDRSSGSWTMRARLSSSHDDPGDRFGSAISVRGPVLAIGAPGEDSAATGIDGDQTSNSATDSGAVYVFTSIAGAWEQRAYLKATNTDAGDAFGSTTVLRPGSLLIGAPLEDSGKPTDESDNSQADSGAIYRYAMDGNGVPSIPAAHYLKGAASAGLTYGMSLASCATGDLWLMASQTAARAVSATDVMQLILGPGSQSLRLDAFGSTVGCAGGTMLVGAPSDDGGGRGIDQYGGSASNSGAVYLEPLTALQPAMPLALLKASNTDAGDGFGTAIAGSFGTIVVGAPGEASAASGVNGDQSDNSLASAGAAYVFH
jgi:hypothetical protein